jgi:hypothetical protein
MTSPFGSTINGITGPCFLMSAETLAYCARLCVCAEFSQPRSWSIGWSMISSEGRLDIDVCSNKTSVRRASAGGEATDFKMAWHSDRNAGALPGLPAARGLFFRFVRHGFQSFFGSNRAVPTLSICADKLDLELAVRECCHAAVGGA